MSKLLTRKILEVKISKKAIRCKWCFAHIPKGSQYTYSRAIGFWGSYHDSCWNDLSVNLEYKDTGELCINQSLARYKVDTGRRLKDLIELNERR